jgi:hypothetical protein
MAQAIPKEFAIGSQVAVAGALLLAVVLTYGIKAPLSKKDVGLLIMLILFSLLFFVLMYVPNDGK